jgi:hypothetical protein
MLVAVGCGELEITEWGVTGYNWLHCGAGLTAKDRISQLSGMDVGSSSGRGAGAAEEGPTSGMAISSLTLTSVNPR